MENIVKEEENKGEGNRNRIERMKKSGKKEIEKQALVNWNILRSYIR